MSYTPRFTNLVTILEQSVKRFGHKPLFGTRGEHSWHYCTYSEFYALAQRMAAGLAQLGVQAGDRVAVISNNRLEWAVGAHGTYRLGAVYVPMYESQLPDEWTYILNDSGAKVCFAATSGIRDKLAMQRDQTPHLKELLCFEDGSYDRLLDQGAAHPISPPLPDDEALASLIYTSGTTGQPKGVMLTHRNLAANVSACLEVAPFRGEERSLAFLPWAHVFGGALELNTLLAYGASMAICGDTTRLLEFLPEVRPTLLFAVPRIWNRVYDAVHKQVASKPKPVQAIFHRGLIAKDKLRNHETLSKRERAALLLADKLVFSKIVQRFGGKLRFAFSAAAALSPEVGRFVDSLGIAVYEGYGLTESSAGATANVGEHRCIGSVGRPMPGVDIRIDEAVESANPGEGEVIIYGTGVMKGYHNRKAETQAALTEDGGLRTGDLGRIDGNGYLYITGRVKELFKLENGKYVAPVALEERLQLSPYISQCVVHGSDRPYLVALIVPDMPAVRAWAAQHGVQGADASILEHAQVRELIQKEIETQSRTFKGFESVRNFILEPEELSPQNGMLTPSLKVKRRVVMERFGRQLNALYS